MHSLRLRACFGIASLIFIFRSNGIAQAQQATTISTKVNLVSVLATVHDKDGKVIKNLAQDDFVVLEDGVSQEIDYFSEEANLPLTVGFWSTQSGAKEKCWTRNAERAPRFSIKFCASEQTAR
jgi:hypothetical protein